MKHKTHWGIFAIFIILPWIKLFGAHLLLFDFANYRFEFAFYPIEANTHQLLIVSVLAFVLVGVLMALNLSHLWCGKFCPNTLFILVFGESNSQILKYALALALSLLFSFSLVAYFIPADELFGYIIRGEFYFSVWLFCILWALTFALIVLLKRWYCSYLCIYGALLCNILPKTKKRQKLVFAVISLIIIIFSALILNPTNLDYCDFSNKELHARR